MNTFFAAAAGNNVISGNTDWGFTSADIWSNGMAIVGSVAGFLILGIVIKFAPRIFTVIRSAIIGGGK